MSEFGDQKGNCPGDIHFTVNSKSNMMFDKSGNGDNRKKKGTYANIQKDIGERRKKIMRLRSDH